MKNNKKKFTTSKIILFAMILMCFEIIIYCEYAILRLGDASAMYALIGIPAAISPTIISYYMKSKAENTVGGVTYDMAMMEYENENYNIVSSDENIDEV